MIRAFVVGTILIAILALNPIAGCTRFSYSETVLDVLATDNGNQVTAQLARL